MTLDELKREGKKRIVEAAMDFDEANYLDEVIKAAITLHRRIDAEFECLIDAVRAEMEGKQ